VSLTAVVFVVIAAFAHAGWNVIAKRMGHGGTLFVWLYQTVSVAFCLPVGAGVLIASQVRPSWSWVLAAVVGAVLHTMYAVVLQRGYATGDLTVVYPVARGSGPLLSISAAVVLLGERPAPLVLAGGAAVVLGVLLIAGSHGRRQAATAGIAWGLLTGATIAGFTLWDALSMTTLSIPPLVFFCARALLQSLILSPHALQHRDRLRRLWQANWREILIVAVLAPTASVSVLYALRLAPISMVAPMRELSVVLAGIAAWRWLNEPHPLRRLTGATTVLAGIAAITLTAQR
jgi:drug/metabolite transporter (DMT)-like permease